MGPTFLEDESCVSDVATEHNIYWILNEVAYNPLPSQFLKPGLLQKITKTSDFVL